MGGVSGAVDDVWEGEFARDYLLRITYGYANYIKNHWEQKEQVKNVKLNNVGIFLGRRERAVWWATMR